jgi:predicted enzyme related to lactoylglutathione lyase
MLAGARSYDRHPPPARGWPAAASEGASQVKINNLLINLTSEDPERLKAFYANVVGLQKNPDMGEDAFHAGGATLAIDGHSETRGQAREPQRVLIDFMVDDIAAEQARLESQGVKFSRTQGKEWWGGVISTFADPDGNLCQIIEYKPE